MLKLLCVNDQLLMEIVKDLSCLSECLQTRQQLFAFEEKVSSFS